MSYRRRDRTAKGKGGTNGERETEKCLCVPYSRHPYLLTRPGQLSFPPSENDRRPSWKTWLNSMYEFAIVQERESDTQLGF